MTTQMLGYDVTLPIPDWGDKTTPADALGEAHASRQTTKSSDLLQFVGPSETFDNWRHLYTVSALMQPNAHDDYLKATIANFNAVCTAGALSIQTTPPPQPNDQELKLVLCGKFNDNKVTKGFKGQGEVMLIVAPADKTAGARVTEEWRGPAFDLKDPKTWPVPLDRLTARGVALQSLVRFEKLQ